MPRVRTREMEHKGASGPVTLWVSEVLGWKGGLLSPKHYIEGKATSWESVCWTRGLEVTGKVFYSSRLQP